LADGSTVPSQRFVIRSLKVGDKTLDNVVGSIAPVTGALLLGQSFLSRFSSWSIDNQRQALVLRSNPDAGNTVAAPIQPANSQLPRAIPPPQAEHSPVAGGSAHSSYITIVYRMIKAHLRETPELHIDSANRRGEVDFYVDELGNLGSRALITSSGSRNLDMAVMTAIAAAAPYPAPPNWQPLYLIYNFGRHQSTDESN
jgi:TonB family protein